MIWPVGVVLVKASLGDCWARSAERSGVVSQRVASFCAREGRGSSAKAASRSAGKNLTWMGPPGLVCGAAIVGKRLFCCPEGSYDAGLLEVLLHRNHFGFEFD